MKVLAKVKEVYVKGLGEGVRLFGDDVHRYGNRGFRRRNRMTPVCFDAKRTDSGSGSDSVETGSWRIL